MAVPKAMKISLLIWPIFSALLLGQQTPRQNVGQSCQGFVQGFYNWYVPITLRNNVEPAWDIALKLKPQMFSHKLFEQLSEDSRAQDKAGRNLVGLDFDPFLNCQDCGEQYKVKKVIQTNGKCRAEVHGMWPDKESEKPDVIPYLIIENGHWVFEDFLYPNPSRPEFKSLASQLKYLRELRQKHIE